MDIAIPGLTRQQSHALIRLTRELLAAGAEGGTLPRGAVHPRTLRVLTDRGLAWAGPDSAGTTQAGLAAVTEALRPLLAGRLGRVQAAADASWLPQTAGLALAPEYGGWHVAVVHQPHGHRPAGAYGPYVTVLPARYHVR
ncbi:hypothetical protein [Candidatus Frankia nodulisporulans]|uniref:hypothetical protein n=1 Tax=Candidatus Frankia nodulisporulans TaxID=2060052 RepID=UPI0013CF43B2|nr:hypothetical protein [Candidatus Frankia nodulisporulans]